MTFYSIYIPPKTEEQEENAVNNYVFTAMDEALKVLKNHKDGRLKTFRNNDDAINYAQTGYECTQVKYLDLKSPSATAEKAVFRAPTKQELIQFRKAIEEDKYIKVKNLIWDNPRYLINSGDTPTSLKDGYRYNALHICAIHKRANIAELILTTINTVSFISLLHGKKDTIVCTEVCQILLDYYLNMPEKGRSETPLHLAVKYGAVEVVEILTTYPQCKMTQNLDSMLPKDIICSRMKNPTQEIKDKIESLLQERFYVPVIRSVDNSVPPIIGQPFSPTNPPDLNIDPLSPELEIQAYAGPMSKDQAHNFRKRWKTPPRINQQSPNKSSFHNNQYISPIKIRSSTPCKQISNDNNQNNSNNNSNLSSPIYLNKKKLQFNEFDLETTDDFKLTEDYKNGNSVESISTCTDNKEITDNLVSNNDNNPNILTNSKDVDDNEICSDNGGNNNNKFDNFKKPLPKMPKIAFPLTPLRRDPKKKDLFYTYREKPNSPLMLFDGNDSYILNNSTSSPDNLMKNKTIDDISTSPALKERHVKLSDPEKGLELVGRELANEQQVAWKEYWDFLDCFINIASDEGLQKLEEYLSNRKVGNMKNTFNKHTKEQNLMNNLCNALDKLDFCKDNIIGAPTTTTTSTINSLLHYEKNYHRVKGNISSGNISSSQQTTPYLCVEKSLQVFAKRCTKTILFNIDSVASINDAFLSELKRLKSLICSFKDDIRFLNVDFTIVHSRFSNLIASYLKNSQNVDENTLLKIQQCFEQIIQSRIKINDKVLQSSNDKKEQLQCVSELILKFLLNKDPKIQPENLKTEKICSETWMNELKCDCLWDTQLNHRQNNRKKRLEYYDDVPRKSFPDKPDDQQENLKEESVDSNESESNLNDVNQINEIYNDITLTSDQENSDDDVFVSYYNSDNEDFYTPPESPSMLDISLSDLDDYNVYLLGNEPTKRDLDVINAIFNADININNYPNIYRWRAAVLRHSNEERDNFPSPSVVVKKRSELFKGDSVLAAKRLFMSPKRSNTFSNCSSPTQIPITTPLSSPISRYTTENFLNYRQSIDSPMSIGGLSPDNSCTPKDLSFMNVSDNF